MRVCVCLCVCVCVSVFVYACACACVSVVNQQGVGISEPRRVKQPQPQDPELFGRWVECEDGKGDLGGVIMRSLPRLPPPTPCWLFVWTDRLSRSTHRGWNTDVRPSSLCATFPKRVNWLRRRFVRLRAHTHPPPSLPPGSAAAAGDENGLVAKYQVSLRLKSCRDTVEDSGATLQRR